MGSSTAETQDKVQRPKVPTAKWGAACAACATAKAKCIRSNPAAGSKCDRCQRLFKECADQVHRPRKKRQVKPSRTAQLEDRLDGLFHLLRTSGDLSTADLTPEALGLPSRFGRRFGAGVGGSSSVEPEQPYQLGTGQWAIPEKYNSGAPSTCLCRPDSGDAPPPPDSDEILLNVFRAELSPLYPFVVVPATVTATHLQSTRPFLMSAIRMVASFRSLKSMRAQMYQIMDHIADHMLVRSERSLDLLLGIIVILGWYQYHCFMHAQLNNLIGLATTLLGDLDLGRGPKQDKTSILGINDPSVKVRTNEEKRALLGVWFMSSSTSLGLLRMQPLRYTRYMDRCLKELEKTHEYDSDVDLAFYVRIQYLIGRIAQLNQQDKDTEELEPLPTAPALPHAAYVAAYQAELDTIREAIPSRLKTDKIFQTYLNTAALRLYQPPEATTDFINALSESLDASFTGVAGVAWPLEEMYRSHAALTAWFETWLSVPVSSFYCQTTPTCTQIVYALAMLGRWARLVTPSMMAESPASFPDELTVPQEATGPAVDLSGLTADLGISGAAAAAAADAQSVPGISSSAATPSGNSDSSVEKGPCGYNADRYRDMIDPRLPSALLRLQSQLQHAPGLAIDAPSMLSTVYTRFLQASASIQRRSVESENREPNAWTVSALKIIFTRARLEEWADLVSLGANRPGLDEAVGQQPQAGPDVVAHGMAYSMDGGHNNFTMTAYPEEGLTSDAMGCGSGAPWMPDLTQTGDPVMWLDRYMDWAPHHQPPPSAMVNPQLGNMEQ